MVKPVRRSHVLAIEFGATKVKCARFPKKVTTLSDLKDVTITHFDNWEEHASKSLLEQIPEIFSGKLEHPLSEVVKEDSSRIGVSIRGAVRDGSYLSRTTLPNNLQDILHESSERDVDIENDAVCFARGSLAYSKLASKDIPLPALVLTFGTGVGCAIIHDEKRISQVALSALRPRYHYLYKTQKKQEKALKKVQPVANWSVHDVLGIDFFKWIQSVKKDPASYCKKRVIALIKDLDNHFSSHHFKSIIIGGGNSRFIDLNTYKKRPVVVLSPTTLQKAGIASDSIQLLGSTLKDDFHQTELIPPFKKEESHLF